ncbi:hypothetical protein P9112_010814 [Eukaryota sp. TZLM1-RC]
MSNESNLLNDLDIFLSGNTEPPKAPSASQSQDLGVDINNDIAPPKAPTYSPSTTSTPPPPKQPSPPPQKEHESMSIPSDVQAAAVSAVVGSLVDENVTNVVRPKDDSSSYPFYKLSRYRFLFDVDTVDVAKRMGEALIPFKATSFIPNLNGNPDLYGPFWIVTTLILIFGMAGNLKDLWNAVIYYEEFEFSLGLVGTVASFLYIYYGVTPLVFWALYAWMAPVSPKLRELYCIYGYSGTIFIPAFLLDLLPFTFVWYLTGLIGGTIAGFFTMQALLGVVKIVPTEGQAVANDSKSVLLSMIAGGVQVVFAVTLKFILSPS